MTTFIVEYFWLLFDSKILNAYEISSLAGVSFRFLESLFATCRVLILLFNTDLLTA